MINSKAALKRLPIDTKIRVLFVRRQEQYFGKILILKRVKSNELVWSIDGGDFHMHLEDTTVRQTKNGFARYRNGELLAEYEILKD